MLLGFDAALLRIIALSVAVSFSATAAASLLGLPFGAALAAFRFRGRAPLVLLANALLGLPPVVVGLTLYLLLSRSGPLGVLGILFTPTAMVIAQFILALPIVTALSHRAMPTLLSIGRRDALTAVLAGFGRTISEVGAILIVGGNIAGYTRTMTTAIVLETSKGNLLVALGLGFVLIGITVAVSATIFALGAA